MEPGGRGRSLSAEGGEEEEVDGEGDDDDDDDDRKGNAGHPPPSPPPFSPAPSPSMPAVEAEEDEGLSSIEARGATASGRRPPACLRGGSSSITGVVVVEASKRFDGVESDRGWRLAPPSAAGAAAREPAGARASIACGRGSCAL